MSHVCDVCNKLSANIYNYYLSRPNAASRKISTCLSCHLFFRRKSISDMKSQCEKDGKCLDGENLLETRPLCRPCWLNKFLKTGMTDSPSTNKKPVKTLTTHKNQPVTHEPSDSERLEELRTMNEIRKRAYYIMRASVNPSYAELVIAGARHGLHNNPIPIKRGKIDEMLTPWASQETLIAAEIIKSYNFYKELLMPDRVILLKNVALKSHHLCLAFDSYMANNEVLFAPTKEEIFPDELFEIPKCREVMKEYLENPIKPLQDLKLSENEFLLLNMIVICNPALFGLSQHAQEILSSRQQESTRLLLKICLHTDPRNGPSRFAEILAIDGYLTKQGCITSRVATVLRQNWTSNFSYFNMFWELVCAMEQNQ